MCNKELWLKLLSQNDTALASLILLSERYITMKQIQEGQDFIDKKKKWLYEEADPEKIALLK